MKSLLTALRRDIRGTTSIEYSLICGLIFLAIVGAVSGLGDKNHGMFAEISSKTGDAIAKTN